MIAITTLFSNPPPYQNEGDTGKVPLFKRVRIFSHGYFYMKTHFLEGIFLG
jgi:hypothetical protein